MKKLILAIATCLALGACTVDQVKTNSEIATVVAETAYAAACNYYQANAAQFSPEDALLFEEYLGRFRLALDQGYAVGEMVQQWYKFYGPNEIS